jgi:hypothetical protein
MGEENRLEDVPKHVALAKPAVPVPEKVECHSAVAQIRALRKCMTPLRGTMRE